MKIPLMGITTGMMGGGELHPPYTVDFSALADGAAPYPLDKTTWSISSGKLVNTPTLGLELLANAGFETAGAGDPDFFADWTESIGSGAVADEGSLVHAGSHAAKVTAGALANTFISQVDAAGDAGDFFEVRFWTRGDGTNQGRYQIANRAGAVSYGDSSRVNTGAAGTDYVEVIETAFASSTGLRIYGHCPAANAGIAYFDDFSAKLHTDATQSYNLRNYHNANVKVRAVVSMGGTWTPVGVIVNANSETTPTSMVLAYVSGTYVYLTQVIDGVRTNLIKATSGSTDKEVRVEKLGTTYKLFYDNVQKGTDQTISDTKIINNTIHGLYNPYSGNTISSYAVEANSI